ncbi:MAG: DUF4912 domain-containing protein [Firmicutes bacterium]|nr:DUF4912 domain-containing protein [Bacillota bacterium]
MQDSAGMTGREKKNRIEMGEDIPAIQNTDSPSGLYTLESPGRSIPGSSIPAERPAFAVQEPLPPAPDPPEYFLPRRYDETILSLMVRDPYWVYAYWDISTTDVCRIDRDHGYGAWSAGSKILRVYDVTDGGAHLGRALMNIGIGDDSASWYINVPEANRAYCADMVLITPAGREIVLARSNSVFTPRDGVSDVIDEEWMVLREYDRLYWMSAGFGPSSPEFQRRFVARAMKHRLLMGSQLLAAGFSPAGPWGAEHSKGGMSGGSRIRLRAEISKIDNARAEMSNTNRARHQQNRTGRS